MRRHGSRSRAGQSPGAAFGSPANGVCVVMVTKSLVLVLFFFFNFEGETFNFKMSSGNRDIGTRTRVLRATCTSQHRRSCGPCLCGPLKSVGSEPDRRDTRGACRACVSPAARVAS